MSVLKDIWPCWSAHGWEMASEFSVQAGDIPRATAISIFARTDGCSFTEVGAWKRHIRALSRQELYEWWVEANEWRDDETGGGWEAHPDAAPDDWEAPKYDESMPTWEFCKRDHPEAEAVWIVGLRRDGGPR